MDYDAARSVTKLVLKTVALLLIAGAVVFGVAWLLTGCDVQEPTGRTYTLEWHSTLDSTVSADADLDHYCHVSLTGICPICAGKRPDR